MTLHIDQLAEATTEATIYIQVIIDSDSVMKAHPNPSQDPNKPTGIAHNQGFMVAASEYVKSGQGTGDLVITAEVGDTIRWTSSSTSNNFDSAAFTYRMDKFRGAQVTDTPEFKVFRRTSMVPTSATPPTVNQASQSFWFMTSEVLNPGEEGYNIQFGLYTRDRGVAGQNLYGYFYWDPTIIVNP